MHGCAAATSSEDAGHAEMIVRGRSKRKIGELEEGKDIVCK